MVRTNEILCSYYMVINRIMASEYERWENDTNTFNSSLIFTHYNADNKENTCLILQVCN